MAKTKRRRSTGQQPGTKRASRPTVKPVVNRGSNAGFVPPPVSIGIPLFVFAQGHPVISLLVWETEVPSMQSSSSSSQTTPSLVRASGETLKRRFCQSLEVTRDLCFMAEQTYWHAILPDPARPLRRAPRRDPPVVCLGLGFDRFRDMPCMKRVYRDKKASVHWSAARKKERFSSF